ncbi:hypothetical protein SEA_SCHOOLBUS_77 [Mycobacterium phage SchoolBus]|nr:hypothetical protein SEA_SCHOOLBUS_77 [Mycobacterium phage SchoolBus]
MTVKWEAPPRRFFRDLVLPFDRFMKFCRGQVCGRTDLDGSSGGPVAPEDLTPTALTDANVVCSKQRDSDLHIPILDLDMDAMLLRSSTYGHYHLYIDKPMSWENYCKLLDVMAEVGILEQGYVDVSKKRSMTQVRTPWTKKGA